MPKYGPNKNEFDGHNFASVPIQVIDKKTGKEDGRESLRVNTNNKVFRIHELFDGPFKDTPVKRHAEKVKKKKK